MFDNIFSKANEYLEANIDLELAEIVKSSESGTPRKEGAFMFVGTSVESFGTVGGGNIEYQATLYAKELLAEKKSGEKVYNLSQEGNGTIGMVCGGNSQFKFTYLTNDEKSKKIINDLKDKYKNRHTVYIFGAGHVSMELAKILGYLNFDIIVWDDRSSFANVERFPNAKRVICKPMENVNNEIKVTDNDFVVVMTRGHIFDYLVEKQVLESKAAYIGVIGSLNKNKVIREKLIADGFSEERVKNVCAPIGIPIAAETPEEIAVSIASELVLFRSRIEKRRKAIDGNKIVDLYIERGINI